MGTRTIVPRFRAYALLAGLLLLVMQSSFGQRTLGIATTQGASEFREQLGKTLTFVCPATDGAGARVYGTDTYSDYSSICAAAIHAGVLKPGAAGAMSLIMARGAEASKGSERNGIASQDYAAGGYSFTFARSGVPGTIAWTTVWNQVPEEFDSPVVVECPGGGETDRAIWGTDVYITDSSICVAAVHAGVITSEKGGVVAVTRAPGLRDHPGTERNGVKSQRWSAWEDAFSVTAAVSPAPPQPSPILTGRTTTTAVTLEPIGSQPSMASLSRGATSSTGTQATIGPRTIRFAELAAVGSSMVPRTLRVPAVNAEGTAIVPRTIRTGGVTSIGSAPGF
jgi:hypothetical protein